MESTATLYLNVLRAQTLLRLQEENLRTTRSNLELARSRAAVGVSGPSDVFRWEASLAQQKQSVLEAQALVSQAQLGLNLFMNRPLEERLALAEPDEGKHGPSGKVVEALVDDPWRIDRFREFMVAEGLQASPELAPLDEAIAGTPRLFESYRRTRPLPVAARA